MLEEILSKKEELAALCRKHHVCKLAVFGSASATTSTQPAVTATSG